MSFEPSSQIAGAARNRSLALKSREALLVTILFADGLALCERNDLGDRRIAIVHDDRAARADVIQVARSPLRSSAILAFFMTSGL